MSYQPHTLVTFGGTLTEKSGGDEIWQCGVRGFAGGGGQTPVGDLHDLALAILRGPTGAGGGLEGLWGGGQGYLGNGSTLKWCKASNIGPDGHLQGAPGLAQGLNVTANGGAAAPSFCSVAISWTTGQSFGKAQKGRIYPPNFGAPLQAGAIITDAAAEVIAQWGLGVLSALDTTGLPTPWNPFVVSESGVSHLVTGVRVGNVYDTQRRRKDKVPETYTSHAFTP